MVKQISCRCWVAVGVVASIVLAANAEGGRAGKPAVVDGRKADANTSSEDRGSKSRESERAKRELQTKKRPAGLNATLDRWNTRLGKYVSFGPLAYRIFPLALFLEGQRAFEFFRTPDQPALPPQLISAQFSRQFVEQYFQRAVESDHVVDDTILGTKIDGRSHLSGAIGIALVPSSKQIQFDLVFRGVCRSRTAGVNTVVVLQNTAETQFEARKQFVWNSKGLTYSPTVAVAETRSTTNQIDTNLPGVIGQVARQIAQERVAAVRPQADALAAQHAAARIEHALDARVDDSLAWSRSLSRHLPTTGPIRRAMRVKLSCTPEAVEILILRRDVAGSPALTKVSSLPDDCDLSIQIHRGMMPQLVRDPVTLLVGAAIANQIFTTEDEPVADTQSAEDLSPPALAWRLTRSPDDQWLVVQHIRQAHNPGPVPPGMPALPAVR